MKKIFLILIAVVAIEAVYFCNRENEPIDENATTRGTNVTDSTKNRGITLNTEWEPACTVNF